MKLTKSKLKEIIREELKEISDKPYKMQKDSKEAWKKAVNRIAFGIEDVRSRNNVQDKDKMIYKLLDKIENEGDKLVKYLIKRYPGWKE